MIEDFKIALARTPINTDESYVGVTIEAKSSRLLSAKTVNNCLTVLRRMLVVARKRGHIDSVPDFEWLKCERPDFDFSTSRKPSGWRRRQNGWRTMILVALRTGMRHGELIGLRWQDVDLVVGRLTVRQNVVSGLIGTPKSGKPLSPPASVSTTSTGITGYQGPTRWRADGFSPCA